jgi:Flp pilus assembly pilin Flp
MRDPILRVTARAHVALTAARQEFPERLARLGRTLRDQSGQDIVEYGGILVLVAAILAVLITQTNIPSTIASDISKEINNIFSTGGGGASSSSRSGG